jgi:hypothetical protein
LTTKLTSICNVPSKMRHKYDNNQLNIRYKFLENEVRKKWGIFYLGHKVIKKVDFKCEDHLVIMHDKKNFIIEKNIWGSKLVNYSTGVTNFVQLYIPPHIVEHYNLPQTKKIITLDYKLHVDEKNPHTNYIEISFYE